MMRTVVDSLHEKLLKAYPPRRAYAHDDFRREVMPKAVAHFLDRTLRERAKREVEHLRLAESDWIDYEAAAVRRARRSFAQTLQEHAQVPPEAWEDTLHRAIRLVTAYLTRPVTTLVDFVFEDAQQSLPMRIIQQRIGHFTTYTYLHDIIERYVERKGVDEMDRARFSSLLHRIDQQMVDDYGPDEWLRMLKPLFAFMKAVPATSGRGIPNTLLQSFFKDKNVSDVAHKLQAALDHEQLEMVSPDRLRQLLQPEKQPEKEPAAAAPPPEPAETTPAPSPSPSSPDEEVDEGPVPLWKQFRQGQGPRSKKKKKPERPRESQRPSSPRRHTPPPQKEPDEESDVPRWKQFHPKQSATSRDDLATLEEAVLGRRGTPNRSLFINQLFGGSRGEYRRVLKQIKQTGSWSEASRLIGREVFQQNKINIYSDAAISFTDAVQSRFRSS